MGYALLLLALAITVYVFYDHYRTKEITDNRKYRNKQYVRGVICRIIDIEINEKDKKDFLSGKIVIEKDGSGVGWEGSGPIMLPEYWDVLIDFNSIENDEKLLLGVLWDSAKEASGAQRTIGVDMMVQFIENILQKKSLFYQSLSNAPYIRR